MTLPAKIIYFQVAASSSIGIGHLMRCTALACAFRQQGLDCRFILSAEAQEIAAQLHDFDFAFGALEQLRDGDWLVLDGYDFDTDYRAQLAARGIKILWVDDAVGLAPGEQQAPCHAAAVLNSGLGIEVDTYGDAPKCFLGPAYHPLRPDFLKTRGTDLNQATALTVIFGGSDPTNMLTQVASKLAADERFHSVPVQFICGPAYTQKQSLEYIAAPFTAWQVLVNPMDITAKLAASRLVLTACGSTTFECWALARPMIAVHVAENQANQAEHLRAAQLAQVYSQQQFLACCNQACQLYFDTDTLREMQERQAAQPCGDKVAEIAQWVQNN